MSSTYLTRTLGSGNQQLWTWSGWVKRSKLGTFQALFGNQLDGGTIGYIAIGSDDKLDLNCKVSTTGGEGNSTRVFRDTSGWYHLVIIFKGNQANQSDRFEIYVNGEQDTYVARGSLSAGNGYINSNIVHGVGALGNNGSHFDGSMSHVHFIDGTAYTPSAFGEYDANGVWKIKTDVSVTYGTNGFFILKDGNSVTDQSPNTNNFTVAGGTLTKTEDNPSNVFCTLNPLNSVYISFLQGNNTISGGNNGSDFSYIGSTLGASSGKFYWEVKAADLAEIDQVGVALASSGFANTFSTSGLQGTTFGGKGFQFSNGNKVGDGSQSAYMGAFSTDDIAMIALDLDNNKITFGRNGQWSNGSGGADQTYANSTAAFTNLTAGETYMPAHAMRGFGGNTGISRYNFGNGYFGTTAVASAGTNASGIGIFEYDVPTGFTSLSTKGLNL